MFAELDRRSFLGIGISTVIAPAAFRFNAGAAESQSSLATGNSFPQQDPALAQEMVGASHNNLARVKELLAQQPALAKAAVDWGFGDWESALGAASHVGSKPIADLLIEAGARPSIFSAAMMGQLDVVKAFINAAPGIQRTLGPHSITLLSHARAGGAGAQSVVDYLVSVGGADTAPPFAPITAAERSAFAGIYAFGTEPTERFEISIAGEVVSIQRTGYSKRTIRYVGNNEFRPVGGERVRLRFEVLNGVATSVAVLAPAPIVAAKRV